MKTIKNTPKRLRYVFQSYAPPLYFITINTMHRRKILDNIHIHDAFLQYAHRNAPEGRAIGRYVIMPDHIHFFARLAVEFRISDFVRLLKQSLTRELKRLNKNARACCRVGSMSREERCAHRTHATPEEECAHRTHATPEEECAHRAHATPVPGPYWQPGFFDHVLRNSESYSSKWNYVVENPVRAGLVEKAEQWPWQGEIVCINRG